MTLFNTLRTAWQGMIANKLRAALTALGVIIGVASVITTLALGNGARAAVRENFRFLGSDQMQITPRIRFEGGETALAGERLTYEDGLSMPEAVELVDRVDMSVSGAGRVRRGRIVLDMRVTGTNATALVSQAQAAQVQPAGWPEGQPLTAEAFIGRGRFFTPAEVIAEASVCVLGYKTADDLFEGDDPIGETIWVNRKPCEVIGVLTELEWTDPSNFNRENPNESFTMPISTAIHNLFDEEPSVTITAHVADESRMTEAKAQVAAYLRERHGIEEGEGGQYDDDFDLRTQQDILGAAQEAARIFALLLAALAAVSLAVGGIGIMNVMLVSVTERTREIGVRIAVGARRRDVVAQFLFEAMLLSAASGLFGIVLGTLVIPLAGALSFGALLDPASIPLSFGIALLTGVAFGLYPAVRASRLDPIEALRYE
jgi:ABC-type antimicrobial peptide transport system permease subunit